MRKVEQDILMSLGESKRSFWELLERNQHTLVEFVNAIKKLYKNNIITYKSGYLMLTEKGASMLKNYTLLKQTVDCKRCEGKGIELKGFEEILNEYRKVVSSRPEPVIDYFQGYMRDVDVISRVAFIHRCGDLVGKSFILIGDDDLLSIALSLTGAVKRILVLDADDRIGEYIMRFNKQYGQKIEFIKYSVSNPLPKMLTNSFDVFSSEPLESLSGLKAFVLRGVSCLNKDGVGYFGLTTLEASPRKWFEVQRLLLDLGCYITDIRSGFSVYPLDYESIDYESFTKTLPFRVWKGKRVNWYKSSLIRFKCLKKKQSNIFEKRLRVNSVDRKEDITYPGLYNVQYS